VSDTRHGFETLAIHAGQEPDAGTGSVVVPIYQTSTYKQDGVGGLRGGYEYGRSANPTRAALQECLAALEGGAYGLAFASGLAAEDCLLRAVLYPGLPDHPGHEVAAKQMRAFGGMVSFTVHGGEETALRVCERTEVFILGESLGGVESLIEHPARMTHVSVAGSQLEVPADLVRLSVGIETADDLLADLAHALDG